MFPINKNIPVRTIPLIHTNIPWAMYKWTHKRLHFCVMCDFEVFNPNRYIVMFNNLKKMDDLHDN